MTLAAKRARSSASVIARRVLGSVKKGLLPSTFQPMYHTRMGTYVKLVSPAGKGLRRSAASLSTLEVTLPVPTSANVR